VRAKTLERMRHLQQRVTACFEAGAVATGARLELSPHGKDFADLRQDAAIAGLYAHAAEALGRTVGRERELGGSTDMGNVSHLVPAIQPMIGYDTGGARQHIVEFAAYGTSPGADQAILDGATAMAATAVQLALDPGHCVRLLDGVRERGTRGR
jgi:metal-dependent amidase/aminoacylase/carboxypeptidase family protein